MIFGEEEAPAYDHLDVSLFDKGFTQVTKVRSCRLARLWVNAMESR